MTHADLVKRAAKWLWSQRCSVVVTEMVSGRETPDAIGWKKRSTLLIECKASRADFQADKKKFFRQHGQYGLGSSRYYMTPPGLLHVDEVPQSWGLLEVHANRVMIIRRSRPFHDKDVHRETGILLSCIRRIGRTAPEGISVRFYIHQTKNTATLGVAENAQDTEDFEQERDRSNHSGNSG